MNTLKNGLSRALSYGFPDYSKTRYTTISDVDIRFKPSGQQDSVSWYEWKETLENLLPLFDSVGWLDNFTLINIQHGTVRGSAVAVYSLDERSISLENNVDMGSYNSYVLDHTREHILAHEMMHHIDMYINGHESRGQIKEKSFIQSNVSYYAGVSLSEAIAEIGAGILLGRNFPESVHEFYEDHDGPQEVYELNGKTL